MTVAHRRATIVGQGVAAEVGIALGPQQWVGCRPLLVQHPQPARATVCVLHLKERYPGDACEPLCSIGHWAIVDEVADVELVLPHAATAGQRELDPEPRRPGGRRRNELDVSNDHRARFARLLTAPTPVE